MIHITLHGVSDAATGIVTGASLLFWKLPSPDVYNEYPRVQKWYKLFYITLQVLAISKGNDKSKQP